MSWRHPGMHDECFYFGHASCLALYGSDILMIDYEDAEAEQQERSDAAVVRQLRPCLFRRLRRLHLYTCEGL